MRTPYQKYLVWLLLKEMDPESIKSHFFELSLPKPNDAAITAAQDEIGKMTISPGCRRRLLKCSLRDDDLSLLDRLGMGSFARLEAKRTDEVILEQHDDCLKNLIGHPVLRTAVECMLIKKIDHEELQAIIQTGYGVYLKDGVIEHYRKHYFDFAGMGRSDWIAFMDYLASDDSYTYKMFYAALTKHTEDVKQIVGLPTKKNFSSFLQTVLSTAEFKFRQYATSSDAVLDVSARKWAEIGMKAGERYEKFGEKDARSFSDTVQTEFTYVEQEVSNVTTEMLSGIKDVMTETEKPKGPVAPTPEHNPEMFREHEV